MKYFHTTNYLMWSMTWQHPIVSASIGCTSKTTVDRRQPYKWVVRRLTTHIDSSWILATEMPMVLRTPLEPGVRVRKELYKPERSWVCNTTLLPIYIYLTNPRGLYVTSPNVVLALSFLHYVMQVPLLRILRHINVIEKWTRYITPLLRSRLRDIGIRFRR